MPSGYATASDAAWYAGVPVGTIWRWASEGRVRKTGKGKQARYYVFDLIKAPRDEYTREQLAPGVAPPLPAGAKAA
ncbi:helix-turn-helix domain-containing protein [Streptomyces bobili]|uniref:DNA-binding protein n=1 Tax=Streptomyces bobili TaxID=67280 RepID=UPI00224FA2B1|nr:DNA-binding protein [Streptomyces bobili]MCX5522604.1 helix-turn-helix domain-containing protein [Streptomyces bobili]